MWQVEYAVKKLQKALTRVKEDRFTPASLSPEISDYLIDLTILHRNENSDFSKFVISLPFDAIEDELLTQIIPERHRQKIVGYRTRHKILQTEKENHLDDQDFDKAARCRDQQQEIAQSIHDLVRDQEIMVTPAGYKDSDERNH